MANFIAAYLPQMNEMGLRQWEDITWRWDSAPRVVGVHRAADLTELSRIISTKRFRDLNLNLKSFVFNYSYTVHEPLGRLKKEEYTIQKGVWKFNQYYDLRPGMKEASTGTSSSTSISPRSRPSTTWRSRGDGTR